MLKSLSQIEAKNSPPPFQKKRKKSVAQARAAMFYFVPRKRIRLIYRILGLYVD